MSCTGFPDTWPRRIVTQLQKQGVGTIIYTDSNRDENIKKVSENPLIYLLDTPGVLSPHIESVETGMKLALCGTILDHLVGEDIIADYLLYTLNQLRQYRYVEQYELEGPCPDIETLLKRIALKLGKTQRVKAITGIGNVNITVPNYSAAAYDFIRCFRKGNLGRMTLD